MSTGTAIIGSAIWVSCAIVAVALKQPEVMFAAAVVTMFYVFTH